MFVFKVVETRPAWMMKRQFNRILAQAYFACGLHWHRHFLPKHFTKEGAREYGYTKRRGENLPRNTYGWRRSYHGRKARQMGHTDPLVWSGQSRTLSRIRNIYATSKRVRVPIRAPALSRKHPKSRVDMRKEVEAVSPEERTTLLDLFKKTVETHLHRLHGRWETVFR